MKKLAPARFLLFAALLVGAGAALSTTLDRMQAIMASFDVAAAVFLVSCLPLLNDDAGQMRRHSRANDANRAVLLAISVAVTIVVLVAVADVISGGAHVHPTDRLMIIATLALAWLFGNSVYALHYAHLFYLAPKGGRGDSGGIEFPKTKEPDYSDFVYFSFTLGMTFQTSDCNITSKHIRRVVIGHCLVAFVYNLGVLAFTINLLASGSGR